MPASVGGTAIGAPETHILAHGHAQLTTARHATQRSRPPILVATLSWKLAHTKARRVDHPQDSDDDGIGSVANAHPLSHTCSHRVTRTQTMHPALDARTRRFESQRAASSRRAAAEMASNDALQLTVSLSQCTRVGDGSTGRLLVRDTTRFGVGGTASPGGPTPCVSPLVLTGRGQGGPTALP